MPLIDTKCGNQGKKEYCDVIVYTDKVKVWDEVTIRYYELGGYAIETKDLNRGIQRIVKKSGHCKIPLVSMTYDKTSKCMVQPGGRCESNILVWISDFQQIKANMSATHSISSASSGDQLNSPLVSPSSRETKNPPVAPGQQSPPSLPSQPTTVQSQSPKGKASARKPVATRRSQRSQMMDHSHLREKLLIMAVLLTRVQRRRLSTTKMVNPSQRRNLVRNHLQQVL